MGLVTDIISILPGLSEVPVGGESENNQVLEQAEHTAFAG